MGHEGVVGWGGGGVMKGWGGGRVWWVGHEGVEWSGVGWGGS